LPSRVKPVNAVDFMRVCREPIERGGEAGLVGNGAFVLKAHRMLYDGSVGGDWEDALGSTNVLNALAVAKPSLFTCPKCKHMYI